MTWVNPLAWFGLAAVAVPIVVHLLAHSRAPRMPFPTLRFIQSTRLAAIRRRALDDIVLLAVRSAIVLLAVAAFAGPLLLTSSRRAEWNARRVRAIVVAPPSPQSAGDSAIANLRQCAAPECVSAQTFESRALSDGIRRAVAWLESAPPARREVVIAAPLTL